MTSSWLRAIGALSVAVLPAMAAPQNVESCTVRAEASRRLELPDGRIASVDVKSVAASGGSVMAVGRYVYLFPRHATPTTSPLPADSVIGVLMDSLGTVSMVPSPMPDRSVVFARVTAEPPDSYHVLFATGIDSIDERAEPGDTASLWYSRFTNGAWTRPQHVVRTTGAELDPEFTSGLIERAGSLTFVFPFAEQKGGVRGGVIVLRGRNGRWSSDTLRTYRMPMAVRAVYAPDGDLVLLTSQLRPGGRTEEVHLWRPGSTSREPRPIGDSGIRPVSDIALISGIGEMVAAWSTWEWLAASTNVVRWARVIAEQLPMPAVLDSGETTYPFELVMAAGRYPLWLYQGHPYGSTLSYVLRTGHGLVRGLLTIPFHNARPKAAALAPDVIRVFTMKRGFAGAEPMIASYRTDLRIRCPSPAQR